jgi:FMN-dependent NADH-azoreductase
MKVLQIDSSILGEYSASRQVTAVIVARLKEHTPKLTLTYRDLATEPLAHLTLNVHAPTHPQGAPASDAKDDPRTISQTALDEFLAADVIVVGAPMYNFTIPSQLKAWIDRILVAGKTFSYSAEGPKGLVPDKRVIIGIARGGAYGAESAMYSSEHAESLLRSIFAFIGVTNLEVIIAEKLLMGDEVKTAALKSAVGAAAALKPHAQA